MQLICLGVLDWTQFTYNLLKMLALHFDMNVFGIAVMLHNILNGVILVNKKMDGEGVRYKFWNLSHKDRYCH